MNFDQAYNYLLSLNNLPRQEYMRDGKKCDLYLQRIRFFLKLIGNPEKKIKNYIHVTGTSGKGSTVTFLHNILLANGKKVASSLSPHHIIITERWKVADKNMSKKEFVDIMNFLKPKLDAYVRLSPYDMLSFFEITEIIGFIFFSRKKVDWAILEVGCGGRFDSSNIIPHKKIAVITNIGLDHLGLIGNNKEEIAYEKSGIIKANCEVFTSEKNEKILKIIKKECQKNKVNLNIINKSKYKIKKQELDFTKFTYKNNNYQINTFGEHQINNTILTIEIANFLKLDPEKTKIGLEKTKQSLRLEIINKNPLIILDGAHNPDKMKTTVKAIKKKNKIVNLVVGFSGDKNIENQIKQLCELKLKNVILTRNTNNIFRKVADPKFLEQKFKKQNPKIKTKIFLDPKDAYDFAKSKTKKDKILLVTGSIFLSGEIKKFII
ncbi:MAG: Mur ligase family protein [Patescibacteria group bacterium]